jgi:hypothetical protein
LDQDCDPSLTKPSGLTHLISFSAEGPAQNLLGLTLHDCDTNAASNGGTSIMNHMDRKDNIKNTCRSSTQIEKDYVMNEAWQDLYEDEMDTTEDLTQVASGQPDL